MLINFLLTLTVLCLFSGLALDGGMLQLRRLQLQHAADAAALGALYERSRGNSGWVAAGKADASLNGFTDGVNGVTISIQSPPTSGYYSGISQAIQVSVSQKYPLTFLSLISNGTATPASSSVTNPVVTPNCVFLMGSGTGYYPLLNQGVGYESFSCNVYVDSTTRAIENDAGSPLNVPASNGFYLRGDSSTLNYNSFGQTPSGTMNYDATGETDPLSALTAPSSPTSISQCTHTGFSIGTSQTLQPGTYCGGMNITGGNITLAAGLYIVTGGMTWSNANISGTGVTIYLTSGPAPSYPNSTFQMFRCGTVTLSAPTDTSHGGYTGILVFADRNWSTDGSQGIQIIFSSVVADGIWYALNTGIYNNASTLQGTNYLGIIANNLKNYNGTFIAPTPNYSSLTGGSPLTTHTAGTIVQ